MSFVRSSVAIWLASAALALAQGSAVTVEVRLEQDQFLPKEEMRATVRITNLSGQTLQLGKGNWLTFSVEAQDKHIVPRLGHPSVEEEFSLGSSMTATVRADLAPHFDFQRPGRYSVLAEVSIPQWERTVSSEPKRFDVISGTVLRELEFGVPAAGSGPPEVHKYILQQAAYLRHLRLYCRVTDASGEHTFRVVPIALMVSFSRPDVQLDRVNNLHVLHQIGARAFNYSVIDPDGEMLVRQMHDYTQTRPALRVNADGGVLVVGGARRFAPTDLPSQVLETSSSSVSPRE